jgi:septal ring-binding cell division protein DamX
MQAPKSQAAVPPSSGTASAGTEREARSLLQQGRYKEAALAFETAVQKSRAGFAIDVEVACQAETLRKGFAASGGDPRYMILPYNLHGRACFRVVWGLYKDRAAAEQALKTMPDFFLQNASPRVAPRPR